MRVVIQRVSHASVTIEGVCKSAIKEGFMILVGIEEADTQEDADWLCKKIIGLRVFDDENGVMNKSIREVEGNISGYQPVHTTRIYKERQPSLLHPCCKTRYSHSSLRLFLPRTKHRSRQRSRNRRIRSRHES